MKVHGCVAPRWSGGGGRSALALTQEVKRTLFLEASSAPKPAHHRYAVGVWFPGPLNPTRPGEFSTAQSCNDSFFSFSSCPSAISERSVAGPRQPDKTPKVFPSRVSAGGVF
ncbi:unnamed protein product [Gadus morhua 'NCC']